jgi:hypothetical protein
VTQLPHLVSAPCQAAIDPVNVWYTKTIKTPKKKIASYSRTFILMGKTANNKQEMSDLK